MPLPGDKLMLGTLERRAMARDQPERWCPRCNRRPAQPVGTRLVCLACHHAERELNRYWEQAGLR